MGFILNPYRYAQATGTIFLDNFTDTDSTSLASHTPDINLTGDVWTLVSSTDLLIESNQIYPTGNNVLYMVDVNATNITVTATYELYASDLSYFFITTRAPQAAGSGWRVYSARNSGIILYENSTSRATGSTSITAGVPHEMQVILDGSSIKAYVDATLEIDYTITTTESYGTYFGLQLSRSSLPCKCDAVQVDT